MSTLSRIGYPHALLTYRYSLWKEFLLQLGFDVVESRKTTRSTMEKGISLTVDDTCMPVKALMGHVDELFRENIHYLFVPRLIALKNNGRIYYPCPKMIGLPDLVKAVFNLHENTLPKILDMEIDARKEPMERAMVRFAREDLGVRRKDSTSALRAALERQREYEETFGRMQADTGEKTKIAVVGHPYLMFDDYLSLGLLRKLKRMDVEVVTQFAVSQEELEKGVEEFRWISWGYEREILGAISHFAETASVDGIIYLTSFGCGPFAVVSELVVRLIRKKCDVPVLFLMMDELTGETGLLTRVESFLDMIRPRT